MYASYFPAVKKLVMNSKGNEEEARDIFQDALIIVFEKIMEDKLVLKSSLKTYMYAICRHLWLQKLPMKHRTELIDAYHEKMDYRFTAEEFLLYEEEKLFQEHFLRLKEDCRKIMEMFFDKVSFKSIADKLKTTPGYIKKRKFQCKEMLYNSITKDPRFLELRKRYKEEQ